MPQGMRSPGLPGLTSGLPMNLGSSMPLPTSLPGNMQGLDGLQGQQLNNVSVMS